MFNFVSLTFRCSENTSLYLFFRCFTLKQQQIFLFFIKLPKMLAENVEVNEGSANVFRK